MKRHGRPNFLKVVFSCFWVGYIFSWFGAALGHASDIFFRDFSLLGALWSTSGRTLATLGCSVSALGSSLAALGGHLAPKATEVATWWDGGQAQIQVYPPNAHVSKLTVVVAALPRHCRGVEDFREVRDVVVVAVAASHNDVA